MLDGHDWVVFRPHNVSDACTQTAQQCLSGMLLVYSSGG